MHAIILFCQKTFFSTTVYSPSLSITGSFLGPNLRGWRLHLASGLIPLVGHKTQNLHFYNPTTAKECLVVLQIKNE